MADQKTFIGKLQRAVDGDDPASDGRPFETGEKYQCQGSGTWCEGGAPRLAEPQLQGQLEDCDVCEQGGYTGYNHLNSGGKPSDQLAFTVDGGAGENPWWKCAEMCSMRQDDKACEGWTFAYDGDGHATSYKCYLKWNVEPESAWSPDPNVISGWSMHAR